MSAGIDVLRYPAIGRLTLGQGQIAATAAIMLQECEYMVKYMKGTRWRVEYGCFASFRILGLGSLPPLATPVVARLFSAFNRVGHLGHNVLEKIKVLVRVHGALTVRVGLRRGGQC